jgi:two-component system nitrate/nitrite response regulator NarL
VLSIEEHVSIGLVRRSLRTVIVADVRLYREGMHANLATRENVTVVGAASNLADALRLIATSTPDIVVIDMATRQSLETIRAMRREAPAVLIVAFAVEELEGEILACAEAGVAAYVPCEGSLDDLVTTMERVQRGELLCSPRMAATLFRRLELLSSSRREQPAATLLTSREREVLAMIDGGLSNKEIAVLLHLEISTVKHHVHNVFEKLHVSSRTQAAATLGGHVPTRQRSRAVAGMS